MTRGYRRAGSALALAGVLCLVGCAPAKPLPAGCTLQEAVGAGYPVTIFGPVCPPKKRAPVTWAPYGCGAVGEFGDNLSVGGCH